MKKSFAGLLSALVLLSVSTTAITNNKVVFTAMLSPAIYLLGDNSGPIRFDQVVINEGSGYNPITGLFTAPVTGIYAFYAQLMNYRHSPNFHWWLFTSTGQPICRTFLDSENSYDKTSCFAAYKLAAGQSVYVAPQDGGSHSVEGYSISSFSGFLLFPE